jgi:hypothetical protein
MEGFEYCIIGIKIYSENSARELQKKLDDCGRKGWELVAVINNNFDVLHYLKRPKTFNDKEED